MLLRNYYSTLTASAIGNTGVTEDVSTDLSPRYSRNPIGQYVLAGFPISRLCSPDFTANFSYGAINGSLTSARYISFGNNTNSVTFNDYAPTGTFVSLNATRSSYNTTYDDNTKTYTFTEKYTLTNNSNKSLDINEIFLGGNGYIGSNLVSGVFVTRDLLGENAFTIASNESVKFELTIKYTIAEPLQ